MPKIVKTSSATASHACAAPNLLINARSKGTVHWYGMPVAVESKAPLQKMYVEQQPQQVLKQAEKKSLTDHSLEIILKDKDGAAKGPCAALVILQNSEEIPCSTQWYISTFMPAMEQFEKDLIAGKISHRGVISVRNFLLEVFRTHSCSPMVKTNLIHSIKAIHGRLLQVLQTQKVSIDALGLRYFARELISNLRFGYGLEDFKKFVLRYAPLQLPYLYTWNSSEQLEKYKNITYLENSMQLVQKLKNCIFEQKRCLRDSLLNKKDFGVILANLEVQKNQLISEVINAYFNIPEFSFSQVKELPIITELPLLKERALRSYYSIKRDFQYVLPKSSSEQKELLGYEQEARETINNLYTLFNGLNCRFSLLRDAQQFSKESTFLLPY